MGVDCRDYVELWRRGRNRRVGNLRNSKPRRKKQRTNFLALEVCFWLERYAINVAEQVSDEEEVELERGEFLVNVVASVPKFPPLPQSEHYNLFDLKVLNEIYALPDQVSLANGMVDFIANTQDHAEAMRSATSEACKIGVKAMDLAEGIRSKHKLSSRELTHGDFDVRGQLDP